MSDTSSSTGTSMNAGSPSQQSGAYLRAHLMAIAVIFVWGITFVCTKYLYSFGLTPFEVLFVRTLLAYICLIPIAPKVLLANRLSDELKFVALGFSCLVLYYGLENVALSLTQAANVGVIVATAPLLTAFLAMIVYRDYRMHWMTLLGSITAFAGVVLVMFNGTVMLRINPLGDFLTIAAAASWAAYSLLLKTLSDYSPAFITRKTFFYGLIGLAPFYLHEMHTPLSTYLEPVVAGNLIFLAVIAMVICFVLWSRVVKTIGAVVANNYIYLVPLITVITAQIVLDESMSYIGWMGCMMILCGVWAAQTGLKKLSMRIGRGE